MIPIIVWSMIDILIFKIGNQKILFQPVPAPDAAKYFKIAKKIFASEY